MPGIWASSRVQFSPAGNHRISAAGRRAIAAAQRKRWAEHKAAAEFAATVTKGVHIAIEGELRSHDQREVAVGPQTTSIRQRVWEIRVDSVLKLDRAAHRASNDDRHEEVPRKGHFLSYGEMSTHSGWIRKNRVDAGGVVQVQTNISHWL